MCAERRDTRLLHAQLVWAQSRLWKKYRFDVVLTDLKMEKVDGMAVLNRAKELDPETAVILITGYRNIGFGRGGDESRSISLYRQTFSPG